MNGLNLTRNLGLISAVSIDHVPVPAEIQDLVDEREAGTHLSDIPLQQTTSIATQTANSPNDLFVGGFFVGSQLCSLTDHGRFAQHQQRD